MGSMEAVSKLLEEVEKEYTEHRKWKRANSNLYDICRCGRPIDEQWNQCRMQLAIRDFAEELNEGFRW